MIALVVCTPARAFACSCLVPPPPQEAMALATVVFRGVVTDVSRAEPIWRSLGRGLSCVVESWFTGERVYECVDRGHAANNYDTLGYVATFRATRIWKGSAQAVLHVRSDEPDPRGASCGIPWQVGQDWVVYAYADGTSLPFTNACTRTRVGDAVESESTELDQLVRKTR